MYSALYFYESAKYVFTRHKRKDFVATDSTLSGWQCKVSPFIIKSYVYSALAMCSVHLKVSCTYQSGVGD